MSEDKAKDAYDWDTDDDEREFGERLGVGLHFCHTKKVVFGTNAGGPFESNDGDPQVMLVFGDDEREGTLMLTCSEKAGWVIRKSCSALGVDKEELKAMNVHPADFALEDVAMRFLVGRFGWFNGFQRGQYVNFDPVKRPKAEKIRAEQILKGDAFDDEHQGLIAGGMDSKEAALLQAASWCDELEAKVRAHYADDGESDPAIDNDGGVDESETDPRDEDQAEQEAADEASEPNPFA